MCGELSVRTFQHLAQRLRLVLSRHQKDNMRGGVEHGQSQGKAKGVQLGDEVGNHPLSSFRERRTAGKKRSGMAVRPHAEKDQVQAWPLARRGTENARQLFRVLACRLVPVGPFCRHPVEVLRRQRRSFQHGAADHAVIALRVVRRDATLIHLEQMNIRPLHAAGEGGAGKQFVEEFGRRTAGKRNGKRLLVDGPYSCLLFQARGGRPA